MSLAARFLVVFVLCIGSLLAMPGYLDECSPANSPHSDFFSPPGETPFHEHHRLNAKLASGGSESDLSFDATVSSVRFLLPRPILTRLGSRRRSTPSVQFRNGAPFSTGPPTWASSVAHDLRVASQIDADFHHHKSL